MTEMSGNNNRFAAMQSSVAENWVDPDKTSQL